MLPSAIDTIAMFPCIIPGSVLGITLLLAFNGKGGPMVLSGTAAIMIISLMIRRLAYALRSSSAILYQIIPSVEESAISPGDSPLKAFVTVTAKLMLPLGGFFIALFTGWFLDKKIVWEELTNRGTLQVRTYRLILFLLKFVAPVGIAFVFINELKLL